MLNDLRFALRQLLKAPAFSAVAILTLALGIAWLPARRAAHVDPVTALRSE